MRKHTIRPIFFKKYFGTAEETGLIEKMREDVWRKYNPKQALKGENMFSGVPSREKYCTKKQKLEQGKFKVCSRNSESLIMIKC